MGKLWRVCRIMLTSLMIIVLLLLFGYNIYISAARVSGQALPKLFGWCSAVIISGSMSGAIEVDDVVIAHEQDSYAPGDVILFRDAKDVTVCHRIVLQDADGFTTKGDANNVSDLYPVPPDHVYGKVQVVLRRIGVLQRVLHSPLGLALIMAFTAFVVLWPYYKSRRKEQE